MRKKDLRKFLICCYTALWPRGQSEAGRVLTDAGHQVVEDVLGEERVFQPPEVELQDASYGVHVMVVLVPSQGVLS